jgi:Zn-dependent peptidase ImmA (M78 family)
MVYYNREKEADDLAPELLIPQKALNEYLNSLAGVESICLDEDLIRDIAEIFKVSPAMCILRLRKLNYKVPYIIFA